jgi:hypothetical protein
MAIPSSISIPNLYVKSPISSGIEGLMQGYNLAQARKAQQQKQAMDERQMGLQEQITQMKMRELQEKIDAEKLRAQQAAMLFGSSMPQQEMLTDQAVVTEQPEQKQLTDEQKKQILAQQAYTKGDIGLVSRLMYPQEKNLTALERNLIAAGYVPGTPEYQNAAIDLMTKGMLPVQTEAGRYAAIQAQDLIDKVENDKIFERAAKFLGPQGSLHKGYAYLRSFTPYPDQDYSDLLAFRNQTVPSLGSEIRKLLGDNPSVEQNKMIERVVDVLSHSNNMQEVKSAWETLKQVHDVATRALSMNPLEVKASLNKILKKKEKQSDTPILDQTMITASDGRQYSIEELQKIAAG